MESTKFAEEGQAFSFASNVNICFLSPVLPSPRRRLIVMQGNSVSNFHVISDMQMRITDRRDKTAMEMRTCPRSNGCLERRIQTC